MLEHAWALLTNAFTGVTLPISIDGEKGEAVIFDNAVDLLNGYWSHVIYDGFPAIPVKIPCSDDNLAKEKNSVHHFLTKAGIQDLSLKKTIGRRESLSNFFQDMLL